MMLQVFILYCFLCSSNLTDTLKMPLKEGEIRDLSKKASLLHPPLESVIYPTKYYSVTSCSEGKVVDVIKYSDNRFSLFIKSDSLLYTYTIDTVSVSKGNWIKKGQVVGKLKQAYSEGESKEDFPLIFMVSRNGKDVYAGKYLIFGDKQ